MGAATTLQEPRDDSPPPGSAGRRAHAWWSAVPAAIVAVLLLLATAYEGAFELRRWAPPAIFALLILATGQLAGGLRMPRSPWTRGALACLWLFVAWSILSAAWADAPAAALEGAGRTAAYAGLLSLPLLLPPQGRWLEVVGGILVGGLAAIALTTLAWLVVDPASLFVAGRLDAPVGYRNATACLFALLFWPLIAIAAPRTHGRLLRSAAFGVATLSLALAFVTQSRSIVLGLAVGGAFALLLPPDRVRRAWLAVLAVVGVAIGAATGLLTAYDAFDGGRGVVSAADLSSTVDTLVVLFVGALVFGFALALLDSGLRAPSSVSGVRMLARLGLAGVVVAVVVGGLAVTGDPVSYAQDKWNEFRDVNASTTRGTTRLTATSGQRYDLWRVAMVEFGDEPLTGVGMDNYDVGYYAERHTNRNVDNAHSLAFSVLSETGLIGAGLFAVFLAGVIAALVAGWRRTSDAGRRAAAGLAAAAFAVIGQSMIDWEYLIPGVMGVGFFALGLALAYVERDDRGAPAQPPEPRRPGMLGRTLRIVSALALVVVSLGLGAMYLSDARVRDARAAVSDQERLNNAREAADLNPVALPPRYLEASALESMGRRPAAQRVLLDALDQEPRSFATLGLLGDLAVRAGRRREARVFYRRASQLNPLDVGLQRLATTAGR